MTMRRNRNNSTSFDIDLDSDENLETEAKKAFGEEDDNLEDDFLEEQNQEDNEEELDDPSNEEEDFNEESDEEEQEQEEGSEEEDELGEDSQEDVKNKNTSKQKSPEQKQFGERANKRIRDLNSRAKTAEEYAQKIAQEAEADRKARYEAERERVNTQKELLELKQERLKNQYVAASQDGDYEKQAEASSELAKIGTQLAAIEGVASKYKGEYKPEPRQQMPRPQLDFDMDKANQLASDFEFENPRLLTDQVYKDTATKIAEGLINRGFKPDTEEFYSELSNRMGKAFGGAATTSNKTPQTNKAQTQQNQAKVVAKKPAPQAVSGASRTPAPQSGNNTNSKNNVRLTQDQIAEAQRLGQDLKTYARNQQKINDSIKNKGRVSVYLEDL